MSRLTEIRGQVEAWIDHLNQYNDIAERDLRRWRDVLARGFARTASKTPRTLRIVDEPLQQSSAISKAGFPGHLL